MIYLVAFALLAVLVLEKYLNNLREREWAKERSSLITRIQHPEIVIGPQETVPNDDLYTQEPDEYHLVGTINPDD